MKLWRIQGLICIFLLGISAQAGIVLEAGSTTHSERISSKKTTLSVTAISPAGPLRWSWDVTENNGVVTRTGGQCDMAIPQDSDRDGFLNDTYENPSDKTLFSIVVDANLSYSVNTWELSPTYGYTRSFDIRVFGTDTDGDLACVYSISIHQAAPVIACFHPQGGKIVGVPPSYVDHWIFENYLHKLVNPFHRGDKLGTLPVAEKTHSFPSGEVGKYHFVKWSTSGGSKISADSIIYDDETYFANWGGLYEVANGRETWKVHEGKDVDGKTCLEILSGPVTNSLALPKTLCDLPVGAVCAHSFESAGISSLDLPDSLWIVKDHAFSGNDFTTLTMPSKTKIIEDYAFSSCKRLESVVVRGDVTNVGAHAFSDCPSLKSFFMAGTAPNFEFCLPDKCCVFASSYYRPQMAGSIESMTNGLPCKYVALMADLPEGELVFEVETNLHVNVDGDCKAYYTMDETTPSMASQMVAERIPITIPCAVNVMAIVAGSPMTKLYRYRFVEDGKISAPLFGCKSETSFYHSNTVFTLSCADESLVIKYSLDGDDPTWDSATYQHGLMLSEDSFVRARCYSRDGFSRSKVVDAHYFRKWETCAVPSVSFKVCVANDSVTTNIVLECSTSGAEIVYSTDGSDPRDPGKGRRYQTAIRYENGFTLRAFARKSDCLDSAVSEVQIDNNWFPLPEYTLTFDLDGGECRFTRMMLGSNWILQELPIPEKKGNVFLGWFSASDDSERIVAPLEITRDTTLYAKWGVLGPAVIDGCTWYYQTNQDLSAVMLVDVTMAQKANVSIPHVVNGWKVNKIGDGLFQNMSDVTHVIIENGIEEIGGNAFNGTSLEKIVIPPSVTNFSGFAAIWGGAPYVAWTMSGDKISSAFYALKPRSPMRVMITAMAGIPDGFKTIQTSMRKPYFRCKKAYYNEWVSEYGEDHFVGYIPDNYVYQPEDLHFVDIDAAGGDFGVRSDEVDDFFSIYDEIGDATLITLSGFGDGIKYAFSCEKIYKPLSRYYSNKAVFDKLIPQPKRAGYKFAGWCDRSCWVGYSGDNNYYVSGNTLVAQWEGILYGIRFDKNGIPDETHDTVIWNKRYGKEITLPTNAYSAVGYHFEGWSFTSTPEDEYIPLTVVSNLTTTANELIDLYAQWSYDVGFDVNGGVDGLDSRICRHGQPIGVLDEPSRDGYTFSGWYTEREGGDRVDASFIVMRPTTLFAHWDQKAKSGDYVWTYSYNEIGEVLIDAVSPIPFGEVIVPEKIMGKNVVGFGLCGSASDDGIFEGADQITSVILPASVRQIGTRAFRDCSRLDRIEIPVGTVSVGSSAFAGCTGLQEIVIPSSVTNIGSYAFSGCSPTSVTISAGFDLTKVFPECSTISTLLISEGTTSIPEYYGCQNTSSGLRKLILPSTLRSIESRAFCGCSVQEIVFNEGVTNIDFWAFADCVGIERIELPRSLQRLATTAFGNCANLKSITFPNGNDVYESVGGAVYDQGGTRLVRCPGGATACQMKSGVVSIGAYALWGCELLESVVIPASVAEIGSCAFWNSGDDFHFEGDRPSAKDADVWGPTTAKVCVYFKGGAVGWVDGGKWCGVTTRSEGGAISTFTIVFNPNQGVGGGSFVIEEGSGLDQLPSCSRSGYTFLGWYTSENGGVRITSLANVASDAEYFAHWERNSIVDYQIENGCAIITKGATTAALSGDVVIPSTIEGHPVVAIAGSAFVRNTNVTSLTLPKSVKEIGDYAFFGCRALTTIDLGSVTNIGWHAFTSCCGLKSVTLPGCLETLQGYTFENCSSLERISIPSSVRRIAGDFAACDALKSVSLADGLLEIGDRAFEGCVSLSSIVIPKTVEIVSGNAFSGCERLTALSVSADNPYFSSVDGLLLSKDGRVLVTAAAGCKSFLIPSSVVDVGEESFYGAAVQTLVLPSSVTNIGAAAFFGCENLSSISLAEGVKCIGDEVFVGCTSLGAIVLPATVSYVGDNAFIENGLTNVTFLGNAPSVGTSIYACMDDNFCTYVNRGSKGWSALGSEILPSLWQNYPIRYVSDTPDSSSYGPYVPGEKVSVTVSALVGYTAKGLPSGLKLNKKTGEISGSPTKPTGDAGVTATFTKKGAETLTLKFVVGAIPTINVALQGDTERCKVTGANKSYLVGKKVSLSASSPKGTAFVGWYKNGEPWPNASECTKTKLSYVMTKESLNLTARFEKEKMSLACPGLAHTEFTAGVASGVAGIPLEITTQSGVKSVKATKLPTGMKLVQDKTSKTWSITGAPTKAGTYNAVLSVTAVSGAVQSITIPVTVEALPSWLVGTYTGMVGRGVGENWMAYGTLSLTVAATGKISAKVVVPSGSYSFTATRWDEDLDDAFAVQMKTKKGETLSLIVDGALPWYEARISDAESGNMFSIPNVEPFRVVAWRNEFGKDGEIAKDPTASDFISKIIALKNVALRVTGGKSEGYDLSLLSANDRTADLKLAFDAKGNVKYSGKVDGVSVSGKTVLRIDGSDCYTLLDLVVPIKKAEVMYFAFGFERDELHNPEYDFEIMRMDYQ